MDAGSRSPDGFDMTMLYAAYRAFRRDLARLAATGPGRDLFAADGWAAFKRRLAFQNEAEGRFLWRVAPSRLAGDPPRLAALAELELGEVRLISRMDAVDAALAYGDERALARHSREFAAAFHHHLDLKEAVALPLLPYALSPYEWAAFEIESRRLLGRRGLADYLPWLLDGAPRTTEAAVMRLLPPPVRLLYRASWRSRYRRRPMAAV
ncbi:hypothetical protein [Spirillospora sp. CA-294931]|uniref:hypothetical protein n=1 Tax=Spirillospora sp. CA-294931 TaxID=3240042 RepID=UPI003D8CA65B